MSKLSIDDEAVQETLQKMWDEKNHFSPTSLKTQFSLKNFRVFDHKQGATFNLAPLTILTGCNSSGKSSVVKAILLLRDFFDQLRTQKIADCKLDFGNKLAKLGKFDSARNINSRKGSKMTFAYTVCPKKINKDLRVQLTFETDREDSLNNGYLSNILITDNATGDVIYDLIKFKSSRVGQDKYKVRLQNLDYVSIPLLIEAMKDIAYRTGANIHYHHMTDKNRSSEDEKNIIPMWWLKATLPETDYKIVVDNFDKAINGRIDGAPALEQIQYNPSIWNWRQVQDAAVYRVLFYLPMFNSLSEIPKNAIRQYIYDKIESVTTDEHKFNTDELNEILSEYENSTYEKFIDFYREKENEGLIFRDIGGWFDGFDKISDLKDAVNLDELSNNPFSLILNCFINLNRFIDPKSMKDEMVLDNWASMHQTFIDEYKLFTQFREFFYDNIIKQALYPKYFCNFEYIGDSTINIQRLYSTEREDEFGKLLFKYLDACRSNVWADINARDFINKWVKKFELGECISISQTAEGLGLVVKLHKTGDDKAGRLLADEGFGITKLIGTMINIETAILSAKRRSETGYYLLVGTKRCYPKVARAITTLAIEEPENHLHPRYQALLAEMFVDAYKNYNIHFIVETHSEYMVRKLQTLVAKKELTQDEVSLQYVYDADPKKRPKGEPHVKSIEIREDGTLRDAFGPGFFDEADNLAMDLLTIKAMG